ncbi:MAG TPA: GerMN domain-containing protein [Acidimicrobiales bacterium]
MTRRRAAPIISTALVALIAAGCAIPTQRGPSTIANNKVPFGLLSPEPPAATTTTQPKPSSYVPVKVFLLNSTQDLESVDRVVVSPAPLTSILNALLAGPTSSEVHQGTFTAIPADVNVLSAVQVGSLVTVNFNTAFAEISGSNSELAVAQVVATVTAETGNNTGVIFEISGQRTSVPIASGALVPGPVYLLEFVPNRPS